MKVCNNYNSFSWELQNFFERCMNAPIVGDRYVRIASADLKMRSPRFFVWSRINYSANFSTKVADFTRERRYIRHSKSRRQIARHIAELKKTHIDEIRPNVYRLKKNRKARPVRIGIAWKVHDPLSALMGRIVLFMAFWRANGVPLHKITVRQVQRALCCDRVLACWIAKWLRENAAGVSKKRLRRRIFFNSKPAWWLFVPRQKAAQQAVAPGAGAKKNFTGPEFENDIAGLYLYSKSRKGYLTCNGPPAHDTRNSPRRQDITRPNPELPGSERKRKPECFRLDLSPIAEVLNDPTGGNMRRYTSPKQLAATESGLIDRSRFDHVTLHGKKVSLYSLRKLRQQMPERMKRLCYDENQDFLKQLSPAQKKFFFFFDP